MATQIPPVVTPEGNLNVLDRAGFSVTISYNNSSGPVNISTDDVRFECGSVSLTTTPNGLGKTITVLKSSIDTIEAEQASRFVVINRSKNPPEPLWEGYIFIRNVD